MKGRTIRLLNFLLFSTSVKVFILFFFYFFLTFPFFLYLSSLEKLKNFINTHTQNKTSHILFYNIHSFLSNKPWRDCYLCALDVSGICVCFCVGFLPEHVCRRHAKLEMLSMILM